MCDTFVATPDYTSDGIMIFGKNSDREPNEAQALVRIPAAKQKEKKVRVTYIEIPQVKKTSEIILSKPFEMWGAEMGANEHGLCIGNEALFTKIKFQQTNTGLTGMDMLRLALERTDTASSALTLLTSLIEQYGQDACGGYENKKFYYSNSFIMADAKEAWLLETAGEHWAAKKINGFRSISNGLTLENDYDLSSKNLTRYAHKRGWIPKGKDFSFRDAYSDKFFTYFSFCRIRQSLSAVMGNSSAGKFSLADAMNILRSHGTNNSKDFDPAKSDMGSLCLHATGFTTPSQTTGSMIAEIRSRKPSTFWFTGTSAPCLSVYKPFFFPGKTLLPGENPQPGAESDMSLWWRHEKFHRKALFNYAGVYPLIEKERNILEKSFIEKSSNLTSKITDSVKDKFSKEAISESDKLLVKWTALTDSLAGEKFHPLYSLFWKKNNRKAGVS